MTANIGTPQQHNINELKLYHQNPRVGDTESIAQSLQVNGAYKPIVVNKGSHTGRPNEVLAGNHTLKAHRLLVEQGESQWATIATWVVDVDDEQAARIVLADNRTADLGSYDNDDLLELLGSLDDGLEGTGYDEGYIDALLGANIPDEGMELLDGDTEYADEEEADGEDYDTPPATPAVDKGGLVRRFIQPPFTVIDTRKGEWRDRKRQWVALGVNSGDGRDEELTFTSAIGKYGNWYDIRAKAKAADPNITDQQIEEQYADELKPYGNGSGTSEFDPALAELLITWFSAPGHLVLDPWAGGSVRGIVSAALGRQYVGIDLRPEQIEANRNQWDIVQKQLPTTGHLDTDADEQPAQTTTTPTWLTGDSAAVMQTQQPLKANMIIGCPPYYDLEEYSDNPDDLSNMTPEQFDAAMLNTLQQADRHLQDNSFAVFIVGNVRNKHGNLQDMKTLMQHCAQQIGWNYTNDAILINAAGSAAMRAAGPFTKARTLARVHQDIIIFTKGDRKEAAAKCGDVQVKQLAADNQPEE